MLIFEKIIINVWQTLRQGTENLEFVSNEELYREQILRSTLV